MKSTQFDQLTQVLSARATRRAGLVMLAGLLLTPLIGPGSTVGNVTAARGRRGRGNKDRRHRNRQNAARDRRRQQTTRAASIPASCCRNARCAPKKGAYLVQCCYENQNLDGANFQSANATKANFSKASLKNANFISSNLSGACFVDADITGARFTGANQQGVVRCRTRTSAGIDNSGCGKGSRCCRTCVELGGTGCHLGGSCCGGAPCLGGGDGTCGCPAGAIFCRRREKPIADSRQLIARVARAPDRLQRGAGPQRIRSVVSCCPANRRYGSGRRGGRRTGIALI